MNHSFDVDIAVTYGVNEAIFIENIRFWIAKNKANKRHFYDGRYWTYNSMNAYAELFPYWTTNQVRRIIESLVSKGAIVSGNYNPNPYDRTHWYALNPQMDMANLPNGKGEKAKSLIDTDINTDSIHPSTAKLPTCPTEKIVSLYNQILTTLPSARMIREKRKVKIKSFWEFVLTSKKSDGTPRAENIEQALEWIEAYFNRALENDFLMGRTAKSEKHSSWKCDIDYLMTESGMMQVIEKTGDTK